MKDLKSSREKLIIIALLMLFVGQEALIYSGISEPYPALRMSSFGGNNLTDDGYQTVSVEIAIYFDDTENLVLKQDQFFFDAPKGIHWILTNKFRPTDQHEPGIFHPWLEPLYSVIPGFFISRYRGAREFQQAPETVDWIRNQIAQIAPGKKPEMLSFRWYENQFHPGELPNRQRELLASTDIPL